MPKLNTRIEAFKLVDRAIRLQLGDDAAPSEIEACLRRALAFDPDSIEALEETAHFYDAVVPDSRKVRKYALDCRAGASKVVSEMDCILDSTKTRSRESQTSLQGREQPHTRWKGTTLWKAIDKGIADLVKNRDIVERTSRAYIVGHICQVVGLRRNPQR